MKYFVFLFIFNVFINFNVFWKEIRSYKYYVVIGSEFVGYGIQIFDMIKLFDVDFEKFVKYDLVKDVIVYFIDLFGLGCSYNVVVYEEKDLLLVVGFQF